ncbi:MAG: MBL fold metallo-hydrolase [Nitrospirae bacterium]|nr:MBL fold metallo-hydrolase [Nitrospirota bacterium]
MIFRQYLKTESGCASYLLGCGGKGVCAVVDPHPDFIPQYLEAAEKGGMRIAAVIDTHVHADHVSANRELAARTGGLLYLHESARTHFTFVPVKEGDTIPVGNVEIRVIHTPGHTPESISLLVTDRSRSEEPWFLLTGDTLFSGDAGRPDLVSADGAETIYNSLFDKLLKLPDHLEIYPAHFSGSVCGRGLSGKPVSTLGFEKRFNRALQTREKKEFVRRLLEEVPAKPENMAAIVRRNLGEPGEE